MSVTDGVAGKRLWLAVWLLGVVGVAALTVRMALGSADIGQDQAWLLYAAGRMLHGVELYGSQLTETNPPLIIWMSALPVGLARLFHLSVPAAFYLVVVAGMLASAAWCYRLLDRAAPGWSRTQRVAVAACIFVAESRPALEALGQREHLLVMLILPFLVAFGVRRTVPLSRKRVVAVAAAAAVGICLKPQQVILLAGFTAAVLWGWWRGKGRHEGAEDTGERESVQNLMLAVVVVCAVGAAYGAAVMVFSPLYVRSEMKLLVDTYWAFGTYSIPQLILLDHHFLAYVVLGAGLYAFARRRGLAVSMPGYLLVAAIAASVAFDLQHTGFMYQHIPQDLLAELAIFWLVLELLWHFLPGAFAGGAGPRVSWSVYPAAIVVLGTATLYRQHRAVGVAAPSTLRGFYASLPAGTPVMSLSTNPQAVFPYVEQDRLVLASRFVHLWLLPAVEQNEWYRGGGPKPRKVLEQGVAANLGQLQRTQVTADLLQRQPRFVVVPRCARAFDCEAIGEAGFDLVGWLSRDAAFAEAWARYSRVRVVDAHDQGLVYDVYESRGE